MPPKKAKVPQTAKNTPPHYWCFTCGLPHDAAAEGSRLVNGKTVGVFPQYYVGSTVLRHPKPPPAAWRLALPIVNGKGQTTSTAGHPFVGYCCLRAFQAKEASAHHTKGHTQEPAALGPPETRQRTAIVVNQLQEQQQQEVADLTQEHEKKLAHLRVEIKVPGLCGRDCFACNLYK